MSDDLTVLRCGCEAHSTCRRCASTGSIFWVSGYALPYTPEGEQRAKKIAEREVYSPQKDFAGSLNDGYAAIRQRVADGGEPWRPK